MSLDTPGVPPRDVPRPDADLAVCSLWLDPDWAHQDEGATVTVVAADYAAAGRVFKWLMGQMALAREAHGG
jgi:hypothetical protein